MSGRHSFSELTKNFTPERRQRIAEMKSELLAGGSDMARPVETQMTISCLQCEWSVEATNTSVQASTAFLEAAHSHVDQHEQHALEIVQRLRLYSENYVEPAPPAPDTQDTRSAAARRDAGIQTGFMDRSSREH